MTDETVDLPADPDIKQLAHDVIRDDNEYAIPLLVDFYAFLSRLDEDDHATYNDLRLDESESDVPPAAWRNVLTTLEEQGVVEKHQDGTTTYTLSNDTPEK